jgi:virulence-associated protein VagC
VIQKSYCTHALAPHLLRTLIYDNGASVKDKGIHFAFRRIKTHLTRHFKQHGREGYVLIIDFKSYFANIQHEPLLDIYRKAFGEDERLLWLAELFIRAFGEKGLGLGSEASQISAVAFTNAVHHYIKEILRLMFIPYMDDNFFIVKTKEEAHKTRDALAEKYAKLGIITTPEKTQVVKLSSGFIFLKTKVSISETGRIVIRPSRQSITKQRQKLKAFKKKLDEGIMSMMDIRSSYMSWRGYVEYFNSGKTIFNMDKLYTELFGMHPLRRE